MVDGMKLLFLLLQDDEEEEVGEDWYAMMPLCDELRDMEEKLLDNVRGHIEVSTTFTLSFESSINSVVSAQRDLNLNSYT